MGLILLVYAGKGGTQDVKGAKNNDGGKKDNGNGGGDDGVCHFLSKLDRHSGQIFTVLTHSPGGTAMDTR